MAQTNERRGFNVFVGFIAVLVTASIINLFLQDRDAPRKELITRQNIQTVQNLVIDYSSLYDGTLPRSVDDLRLVGEQLPKSPWNHQETKIIFLTRNLDPTERFPAGSVVIYRPTDDRYEITAAKGDGWLCELVLFGSSQPPIAPSYDLN